MATSYFQSINKKSYLIQAAARSPRLLLAALSPPKKRQVGHPWKASTNNELEERDDHTIKRLRKQSATKSEQENSRSQANTKEVHRQYSCKQNERVVE